MRMKLRIVAALSILIGVALHSSIAHAQTYGVVEPDREPMQPDADQPPPAVLITKKPSPTTITPELGIAHGQWMKLTVTRAVIGIDVRTRFRPTVGGSFLALIEPGKTEAGLGAHRWEVGYGLMVTPTDWLDVMLGAHLSYAMMVRATKDEAFGRALTGDIGGFGLGGNLRVAASLPLSNSVRVVFGLRSAIDVFNRGLGYEVGPLVGLRF